MDFVPQNYAIRHLWKIFISIYINSPVKEPGKVADGIADGVRFLPLN